MNWNEYVSFLRKVEVTPMHFTSATIKATPAELVTLNRLHHGTMGLVGEASEVSELVKKCLYGKRVPFDQTVRDRLLDELGDVFFYFTLELDALGLTLEDIMEYNKKKLSARYPELLNEDVKG